MRVLLFVNLLAIVVIAGALARIYEGTRLPWAHDQIRLDVSDLSQLNTDALPSVSVPLTPNPNPHRGDEVTSTEELPAVLMVATEGAYPPFNGRDAGGELNGYDIDIARALCERIKRTCKFVTYKWQELLPVLKRGEVDVVIASMLVPAVPDNGKIVFSDPYYKTPGHFAARRDAQLGIGGVTSSNMQSIAVQAGRSRRRKRRLWTGMRPCSSAIATHCSTGCCAVAATVAVGWLAVIMMILFILPVARAWRCGATSRVCA